MSLTKLSLVPAVDRKNDNLFYSVFSYCICLIFSEHFLVKIPPKERGKYIWTGGSIWNNKIVKKLPESKPFPYRAMTNGESFATWGQNVQVGTYRSWTSYCTLYISGKYLFNIDLIVVTGTNILIHMNVLMYN